MQNIFNIENLIEPSEREKKLIYNLEVNSPLLKTRAMSFLLLLSFPNAQLKYEAHETQGNVSEEINCKTQKEFKSNNSFVVEKRFIRKKYKYN